MDHNFPMSILDKLLQYSVYSIRVHTKSGEVSECKWLSYLPTTGSIHCFACKLFKLIKKNPFANAVFQDWKHADRALSKHENSKCHCRAIVSLTTHMEIKGCVDTDLVTQYRAEKQYWRDALHNVLNVVQFLAECGFSPFHGENKIFGSSHNGNFLGIVELIAKYDTFLAQHINKYSNMGLGHASYLSSTICEEFIALLGEKVSEHIVKELKEAKYFSISVDSTPDISKCVVRYVLHNGPVEHFLTFLDFETHSSQDIAKSLLQFFVKIGVNTADCWGQSYNNVSNFSGKYQGMQAWNKERSENVVYIPCCAHSLNLVGQSAVDCCFTATSFFSFVQKRCFFHCIHQMMRLAEADAKLPVIENLSETRWSADTDAVTALQKGYNRIKAALDHLSCDDSKARHPNRGIRSFKNDGETQNLIHDRDLAYESRTVSQSFRKRNRQHDDGGSEETQLSPHKSFRIETYLVIINKLSSAL
uniref:DUF4371 domain-containing protein n=1 Tax=Latimeria chalumnae TaxID=7897 RepID=H3BEC3_LATCH